jgi:hypothetical protein
MKNRKIIMVVTLLLVGATLLDAQIIKLTKDKLVAENVSMSIEKLMGKEAVKVILDSTVNKPNAAAFVKLKGTNLKNGTIEVKVLSRLTKNASASARGFIGVAFRINDSSTKFESIYIRPTNGRADDQVRRNHSIQYYSYPDYPFDRLRKEAPEKYESYADMELNRWITLRIEVKDEKARLYIDNAQQPCLIVNDLKHGPDMSGAVALWVDMGTEGYFSDLKIVKQD